MIGRTFRMGNSLFTIVGVADAPFTGVEPGTVTDIFVPTMMNPSVTRSDSTWHRTLAVLQPGVAVEPLREKLNAVSLAFERERAKGFLNVSAKNIENYLHQTLLLEPAPAGYPTCKPAIAVPCGTRPFSAAGSIDCLCQCCKLVDRSGGCAGARNGPPHIHRRGTAAFSAIGADGKCGSGASCGCGGRFVCILVRAIRRKND